MRGVGKEAVIIAAKRKEFVMKAYELFCAKNIEDVSLQDIANATDYGIATLYRYFVNKPTLVVEAATWKWQQFQNENRTRRPDTNFEGMTSAQDFEFYLDSFLELYRNHRDLLRFNQLFNIYIQSEGIDPKVLTPYLEMIHGLEMQFHNMYLMAQQDHTIRTDVPEDEMFSTTLHLMLAAVTRYAVGLVYQGKADPEKELAALKDMLMQRYTVNTKETQERT